MPEDKEWLLSRSKRWLNYLMLKIGLFAVASVWGLADFVNAGPWLRFLYLLFLAGLFFYIYLYIDTRKFVRRLNDILKKSR